MIPRSSTPSITRYDGHCVRTIREHYASHGISYSRLVAGRISNCLKNSIHSDRASGRRWPAVERQSRPCSQNRHTTHPPGPFHAPPGGILPGTSPKAPTRKRGITFHSAAHAPHPCEQHPPLPRPAHCPLLPCVRGSRSDGGSRKLRQDALKSCLTAKEPDEHDVEKIFPWEGRADCRGPIQGVT